MASTTLSLLKLINEK